jgi:hypothetical protein
VNQWLADNRMIPNFKQTKSMVIGSKWYWNLSGQWNPWCGHYIWLSRCSNK